MLMLFRDGGLATWAILGWVAVAAVSLGVETRWRRRTRFPGLHPGLAVLVLAIGLVGTADGALLVVEAFAQASVEYGLPLLAGGVGYAVIPALLAAGCVTLAAPWMAANAARASGPERTAPAQPWVTTLSIVLLAASCSALLWMAHRTGLELMRLGSPTAAFDAARATGWAGHASALAWGAAALGALNLAMAWTGAVRGRRTGQASV